MKEKKKKRQLYIMLISLLDCVKNNEMKFIRVVERNEKKRKEKKQHQFKQYIFVVQTLILVEKTVIRENKFNHRLIIATKYQYYHLIIAILNFYNRQLKLIRFSIIYRHFRTVFSNFIQDIIKKDSSLLTYKLL